VPRTSVYRAVGRGSGRSIFPKLAVSAPGDAYEQEADRVADEVVGTPDRPPVRRQVDPAAPEANEEVRRKVDPEEDDRDETVQRQATSEDAPAVDDDLEDRLDRAGGGEPLSADARGYFEPRFGRDLGGVRVHTDPEAGRLAGELNALAFTRGTDVWFAPGRYAPGSPGGRHLLAHELAHTQQPAGDATSVLGAVRRQTDTAEAPPVEPPGPSPDAADAAGDGSTAEAGPIPAGGQAVDEIGIVNRDRPPELRLRAAPDTATGEVLRTLPFNTHVQVIKKMPGNWYFVSTEDGDLGYVDAEYIWTTLPEPNATLHRVESAVSGTAIAIAERYYSANSDDWGQDLRFYVNVLAWANKIPVPDTTDGWKQVHFDAGDLIWVPSQPFARSLIGVVNSGSMSYNIADALGVATLIERVAQLRDDFATAIRRSGPYLGEALWRHAGQAMGEILYSLAVTMVAAIAILAVSTAIGAAIGGLAGAGAGAAPGAAAGFEVGMVLLQWLGLAFLVVWIGQSLVRAGAAFATFFGQVWDARGDDKKLDGAARQFAESIGVLFGILLEALVMYVASKGLGEALGFLRGTRMGKALETTRGGKWLAERVRRVRAGEARLPTPRQVFTKFYRGVDLVDGNKRSIGELDGVDLPRKRFVENKKGAPVSFDRVNPRTGDPAQTIPEWAKKVIGDKTSDRITALATAAGTRRTPNGSAQVPSLAEIKGIRHFHFVVDGQTPAIRTAVTAQLAILRAAHPGWKFTAEFGVPITLPPVPSPGADDEPQPSE